METTERQPTTRQQQKAKDQLRTLKVSEWESEELENE